MLLVRNDYCSLRFIETMMQGEILRETGENCHERVSTVEASLQG